MSPLLSNIVLDELDKMLEQRGHAFVRYADDCNIYVQSERAGQRVMESVTDFITRKLKLKVNQQKSAVARPHERKFLGFSFTNGKELKVRIAPKALERFRGRVRELTRRTKGISSRQMVQELSEYLNGWFNYYHICETPSILAQLDGWIRRRLRAVAWKHWRHGTTRYRELVRRGVPPADARTTAGACQNPWVASVSRGLNMALPTEFWHRFGLVSLHQLHRSRA